MTAHDINLPDEQRFKQCVNMSLMLAHLSLGYMSRAEEEAKKTGDFKLTLKMLITNAFNAIKRVTLFTDSSLDKGEAMYNADLTFLDRLTQLLIDNVSDSEKQGYLLDFIANGYKLPTELPEVVKSLKIDVHELMTSLDRERKQHSEEVMNLNQRIEFLNTKIIRNEQL